MVFPDNDFLAWQMRVGLASRLWAERALSHGNPDDPRSDIARGKERIRAAERMMGIR